MNKLFETSSPNHPIFNWYQCQMNVRTSLSRVYINRTLLKKIRLFQTQLSTKILKNSHCYKGSKDENFYCCLYYIIVFETLSYIPYSYLMETFSVCLCTHNFLMSCYTRGLRNLYYRYYIITMVYCNYYHYSKNIPSKFFITQHWHLIETG